MEDTASVSVTSQRSEVTYATREGAIEGYTVVKLHTCIICLIGILGFCLQLKFPNVSPYATVHGSQLMNEFIIVTCVYILSLIVMTNKIDSNDADIKGLMIRITILLGTLSLITELLILLFPFGFILLVFWCVYLVLSVKKSYQYLKALTQFAIDHLKEEFVELKQKMVDLNQRIMESNAIQAFNRASRKLKDLIIRNEVQLTTQEDQTKNRIIEIPV